MIRRGRPWLPHPADDPTYYGILAFVLAVVGFAIWALAT